MVKRHRKMTVILFLVWLFIFPSKGKNAEIRAEIKRLTFSGNNEVHYPCLSDDGQWMLYVLEEKDGDQTIKVIKVMNIEDKREIELFRSGEKKAPPPFESAYLEVGSKPPLLSGNGKVAVFSLSLSTPENILDHYLAIINTDASDLNIIDFPNETLKGKDYEDLYLRDTSWERVSNYAVSADGERVACALKGQLGPSRYGNPSAIVLLDVRSKRQRTLLAPGFDGSQWNWQSFPCRPFTGGGWAFNLSGNGERLVFGAQSSADKTDYDLYITDWQGEEIKKLTDFHDRWFSQADISHDGQKIVFFYNGQKKDGMGTYIIFSDGSGLKFIGSIVAPKVELFDLSPDGRYILFKHVYKGMILDLLTGKEMTAFDEETPGYIKGLVPMDFPRFPAFWSPRITAISGERTLVTGPPQGKERPEVYLLILKQR